MIFALSSLLDSLYLGMLLFLLAAGLTLVLGIMRFINLAHGAFYMIGAFIAATVFQATHLFALAGLCAIIGTMLLVFVLERVAVRKLYGKDPLIQVLATFGLILFFNEMARVIWGAKPVLMPLPQWGQGVLHVAGIIYPQYRLFVIVVGVVVAVGIYVLIHRTRMGMVIRASSTDPEVISALGTNARLVHTLLFTGGAGLAAAAGWLVGPLLSVHAGMGEQVLILALVVIVIGGIGSIRGAFYGALLVGLVDTMGRAYMPQILRAVFDSSVADAAGPAVSSMLIYLFMAIVLAVQPHGLFPAAR